MEDELFGHNSPFLQTSTTGNWLERLRLRHRAIVGENRQLFVDANVLDIGSHDGRWSYAAIKAGAKHVTGIELKEPLVVAANGLFHQLEVPANRFEFHCGDIFLNKELMLRRYDLVLCLGLLYHTARHVELISLIRESASKSLILDTVVSARKGRITEYRSEDTTRQGNGSGLTDAQGARVIVAYPTSEALDFLLSHFGYMIKRFDWQALLISEGLQRPVPRFLSKDNPLADYICGERETITATLR